jgi:DNA-binding beta-propeller fold protein YncE
VRVHAAADFSRFAIVEYVEDGVGMAPGQVYVVDPAAGASFSVPAPPAAYGVAFSPDGKYIYLGSAQRGTISRIDIAAGRIDKQVTGPRFLHHLVISPTGARLFALASSSSYAVYDLPDLRARSDAAHPPGVAPAMVELHGHGVASLDGAFFVAPDAEDPRRPPVDRSYVIARLID